MVTHYAFRPISKIPMIAFSAIGIFLMYLAISNPHSEVSILLPIGLAAIFGYLFIRTIFLKNYVTVTPDSLIIREVLYNQNILLKNIKKVTVYDDEYSFFQQKRIVFKLSWWRDVRLAKACVKSSDWPSLVNWAASLQPQQ